MNKQEFLSAFQRAMDALGVSDQSAHYAFFEELFDDMAEEGVSEAEISARLGNPWELAASLLREEMGGGEAKRQEPRNPAGESRPQSAGPGQSQQVSFGATHNEEGREADRREEGKGTSRPSWMDKLNRLLNTAGIRFVINGDAFGNTDTYDTVVPAGGIHELEIHWMAGNLEIGAEDRGDILLAESRGESASPMQTEIRGSCLCVFYAQDGSFRGTKDLMVTLPSSLAGSLQRLTVQSLSADFSLEGITARELQVKTASGEQDIRAAAERVVLTSASGSLELELDAREIIVSTASGDLDLTAENAELAKLSCASGDICCRGSIRQLSINSASGDAEFSGSAGRIQVKTASGDCDLDLDQAPEEMNISSVSGDVGIALPHGAPCHLQVNSRTGDVSFSGIRTDAENAPVYRIQTVSGDIDVHD